MIVLILITMEYIYIYIGLSRENNYKENYPYFAYVSEFFSLHLVLLIIPICLRVKGYGNSSYSLFSFQTSASS